MTAGTHEAQLVMVKSKDRTPIGLWRMGSGPALLAVHGTDADHTAWDSVAPLLADTPPDRSTAFRCGCPGVPAG